MSAAASGAFVAGGACKALGQLSDTTVLRTLPESHALTYRDSWDEHGSPPAPIEVPESQPVQQPPDRQRHPDSATPTPRKLEGTPGFEVVAEAPSLEKPFDSVSVGTMEDPVTPCEVEQSDFGDGPQRLNTASKMVYDKHYHSFLGEMYFDQINDTDHIPTQYPSMKTATTRLRRYVAVQQNDTIKASKDVQELYKTKEGRYFVLKKIVGEIELKAR